MGKSIRRADEPSFAPLPERWYNLVLGPSFGDRDPSRQVLHLAFLSQLPSIRASPDRSIGRKNNAVAVEFHNNQFGNLKVRFEGVSENYKENDAFLFFDGETFRLERLRHVRLRGEAAGVASLGPNVERCSSPSRPAGGYSGNVWDVVAGASQTLGVAVEKIVINDPISEAPGVKSEDEPCEASIDQTNTDLEEHVTSVDSDGLDEKKPVPLSIREIHSSIYINVPQQNEEEVDVSDNEPVYPGRSAADALRAQVLVERDERSSSSSSSSESGSDSSSSGGSESKSESGNGSSRSSSSESERVTRSPPSDGCKRN